MRHTSRGQVFPLWIVAVLTTFSLSFLALDYGNDVRYQIRAQNAADAAAQAAMAIQTQRFNEVIMALYAANVEEYRIRTLLDGMLLALSHSGGCNSSLASGATSCDQTFNDLLPAYEAAVNRYTTDVLRVNDASANASFTNWEGDARTFLTSLGTSGNCNGDTTAQASVVAAGGDCMATYVLNGIGTRTFGLHQVGADAYDVYVPQLDGYLPSPYDGVAANTSLDPGFIDVSTCITVPPVIPTFDLLHQQPFKAIGRAGATAVHMESDWWEPDQLQDNVRAGIVFQPLEQYVDPGQAAVTDSNGNDWYDVNFGGTQWQIVLINDFLGTGYNVYRYQSSVGADEFDANLAWWSAVPYDPASIDTAQVTPC